MFVRNQITIALTVSALFCVGMCLAPAGFRSGATFRFDRRRAGQGDAALV